MFRSMDSSSSQPQGAYRKFSPKKSEKDPVVIVDQWLNFLKFHPFLSAEFEFVGPTEDPKRNGIFIAELVSYLLP